MSFECISLKISFFDSFFDCSFKWQTQKEGILSSYISLKILEKAIKKCKDFEVRKKYEDFKDIIDEITIEFIENCYMENRRITLAIILHHSPVYR